MPAITLRKAIYDALVRNDEDPVEYANQAAQEKLSEDYGVEVDL